MTINQLFEGQDGFLSYIEPDDEVVERAKSAHEEVREILEEDEDSQEWHRDTFLSGSYSRRTSIDPIKDVDIVVVTNFDHSLVTADQALNKVKRVLDRYYETQTRPQRRSILITLGDTDITLDVVPAVAPDGTDQPLLIPDKELKQWVTTHPKAHIEHTRDLNAATKDSPGDRGRLVPLIKMLKWWRHNRFAGEPPKGFALECLAWRYHNPDARAWEEVVVAFFENAAEALGNSLASNSVPQLQDTDLRIDYPLTKTYEEFEAFYDLLVLARDKATEALSTDSIEEKVQLWKELFGDDAFPDAPDDSPGGTDKGRGGKDGGGGRAFGAPTYLRGSPSDIRESEPFG